MPAPHVIVLFDDLSLRRPDTCPPRMAAAPEAMRKGPRPDSSPSPRSADRDTKNAGARADTSSRERTTTKLRKGASSESNSHDSRTHDPADSSEVSPTGSVTRWKMTAPTNQVTAEMAIIHVRTAVGRSSPPNQRMPRPSVMATMPDRTVARPVIWPRWPFGMVRPCTSFEPMEHSDRPSAKTARAARTTTAAAVPSRAAAASAITSAITPCVMEPATHTDFRCARRFTHGVSAACGNIDSDSRMGTSNAMARPGAPCAVNSHGNTVFGLMTWSPAFCRPLAAMNFMPFAGTSRATSSGMSDVSAGETNFS